MRTDTLVIGGGLSGLSLALHLADRGHDFVLLEARDRFGGRILSRDGFDLGPAWVWPGQPRIAALIKRLGVELFSQYARGAPTFEDAAGQVQRGQGFASMAGSYRLVGGLGVLTERLTDALAGSDLRLAAQVEHLQTAPGGIVAQTRTGARIQATRAVLALPLRVAAGLVFAPALPKLAQDALINTPTWMAGQAKVIAVYGTPFWRQDGLSGDAISRCGPMAEIHDASPRDGGQGALFGFIGVPPEARRDTDGLRHAVLAQFARLFGPEAAHPIALHFKDWALDPFTAAAQDLQPLYRHPNYGLPRPLQTLWENRLLFAGAEAAPQFGGYLEGALEAAQHAVSQICGKGAEDQ